LVNQHIGTIHVPYPLLQELKKVHLPKYRRSELDTFHPGPSILEEALLASLAPPRTLSFYDSLCLFLARDSGWICVTNDKALRKVCEEEGIRLLWGLEPLVLLVEKNHLSRDDALKTALIIHEQNPKFIHEGIIENFKGRIGKV